MHFTYNEGADKEKLKQGDVLRKTARLQEILEEVHPHYNCEEYKYFQVLTQSCDLVRRDQDGSCNSRYITLAAVRTFDDVIMREIEGLKSRVVIKRDGIVATESARVDLEFFYQQVLNNNHKDYFFLEAEPKVQLRERHCTLIRLSISIRAYQHYDACLDAKLVELSPPFDAKLGWLAGNLYSRVGTEDYAPGIGISKNALKKKVLGELGEFLSFLPSSDFKELKTVAGDAVNMEVAMRQMEERRSHAKNRAIDGIIDSITQSGVLQGLTREDRDRLRNVLAQNHVIMGVV